MAISARPSTMSLGAAACVVMLFLAQAVLEVNAMRPMLAPTSAPVYAPESAPMYAPEIAPVWSPEYAPEMAPMAPPGSLIHFTLWNVPCQIQFEISRLNTIWM
jgi:hypothetical protein